MKTEIVSMPTSYVGEYKELFVEQADYPIINERVQYTYPDKGNCKNEYTTAIFIVKPLSNDQLHTNISNKANNASR